MTIIAWNCAYIYPPTLRFNGHSHAVDSVFYFYGCKFLKYWFKCTPPPPIVWVSKIGTTLGENIRTIGCSYLRINDRYIYAHSGRKYNNRWIFIFTYKWSLLFYAQSHSTLGENIRTVGYSCLRMNDPYIYDQSGRNYKLRRMFIFMYKWCLYLRPKSHRSGQ